MTIISNNLSQEKNIKNSDTRPEKKKCLNTRYLQYLLCLHISDLTLIVTWALKNTKVLQCKDKKG